MERNRRNRFEENTNFLEDEIEVKEKNKNILKIIFIIIITIIVILFAVFMNKKYKQNKNEEKSVLSEIKNNERKLQEKYYGFNVEGKIYINKIKFEDFFVEENVNAVNSAITILLKDGVIGGRGNLVLMGHNKKDAFKDINKLEENDEIVIENIYGEKTKYFVKTKKEINPNNLEGLISDNTKKELTLLTCTNSEDKRLEIKCEAK